jgi:Leucine-rich repeat (LRR) protein
MNIKSLSQWTLRLVLVFVIAGNTFSVPVQSVSAQPLFAAFTNCAAVTGIPPAECEVLEALYNDTGGASWTNHTGWLDTDTPCSWYGVTCTNGHVRKLELNNNELTGPIPPELGDLSNLTELQLYNNQLTGSIPPELGDLSNLTDLWLGFNQLSGSVPAELGNLTNLIFLWLSSNQFTGTIPPELGDLSNLQYLFLDRNKLSGAIPVELGELTNLPVLDLGNNQLTGPIPPELGNLTNLTYLALNFNQLSGTIPSELGSLTNLNSLSLEDTHLTGEIPASFINLTNLWYLALSCGLTSTNPAVISFINGILGAGWDIACSTGLPPLILVHGFQGFPDEDPTTNGYRCSEGIQEYNGTNGTKSTLGALPDWFLPDYRVYIAHLDSTQDDTPPLIANAKCLSDQIDNVASQNPNNPITIVAHSMGGLVSRAAIYRIQPGTKVKALYTLGSPHAGFPFDAIQKIFAKKQPAVANMSDSSMVDFNQTHKNKENVQYTFIGGDGALGGFSPLRLFWLYRFYCEN